MDATRVTGIDPGLVHTGCVSLTFFPNRDELHIEHEAVAGTAAVDVVDWLGRARLSVPEQVFIEGYRPRSHLATDARMVEAVAELRKATGGTVLNNTGVKQVVRQPLMELLGCWRFATVTHHQDLRSAARIALYGMLKDEQLNALLTRVVADHLDGRTWTVRT